MPIGKKLKDLVNKHDTFDPNRLAAAEGIMVIETELPRTVRGMFIRVLKRKIILVNKRLSKVRQRVVVSHELGHAILHDGFGYYFELVNNTHIAPKREAEANEFAIRLLLHNSDYEEENLVAVVSACRENPSMVHAILADLVDNE